MKPSQLKQPLRNVQSIGDLNDFVDAAIEAARAVFKELEFTYSHPDAAMRGEVYVERTKVPELYQAYWKLQRFFPPGEGKVNTFEIRDKS